jgi:5-methylcytosine-specific restriction endonuclease McrBC regulatory subunit McrC
VIDPTDYLISSGIAQLSKIDGYSASLELQEHQHVQREFPVGALLEDFAAIEEALNDAIRNGLLELRLIPGQAGRLSVSIKANSTVGFSSSGRVGQRLFVRVRPKIPAVRMLELACIANRLPWIGTPTAIGFDEEASLVEWTVFALHDELQRIVRNSALRSTHQRSSSILNGHVRGKVIISQFIGSLARGRPDLIPCEFSALTQNNVANRLLLWAVQICERLAQELPALKPLQLSLRRIAHAFRDVPVVRPSSRELDGSIPLPPNQRHYAKGMQLARMLVRNVFLDGVVGSTSAMSAAIDMNALYQDAFFLLLKSEVPTATRQPIWWVEFRGLSESASRRARFQPDVFVPATADRSPIVIDTKWKRTQATIASDDELAAELKFLVKPRTSDIQQMMAYASQVVASSGIGHQNCIGALVYPAWGPVAPAWHHLRFDKRKISLCIISWDLSKGAQEGIDKVWHEIRSYPGELGAIE